jgi:hypothetical protein
MADDQAQPTKDTQPSPDAVAHVAEAHRRLTAMRTDADKFPDLEAAIERLEMALSILTTKTGGML